MSGLSASFAAVLCGVAVGIAIHNDKFVGGAVVGVILGGVAVYQVGYARGAARACLKVTDRGVFIRNLWRTREFPISDVSRFAEGMQGPPGTRTPGVVLVLKDGRWCRVWTLTQESYRWTAKKHAADWQVVVDDLNRLLRD